MAKYRVLLHVRGLDVEGPDDPKERVRGFYVACLVGAPDESAAGERAIAELRAHPKFQWVREQKRASEVQDEQPEVLVAEVEPLGVLDRRALGVVSGFVFYSEKPGPSVQ